MMRRVLSVLVVLFVAGAPLHGQSLSELISRLFVFGTGDDPLQLTGTGGFHQDHFVPSAVESNGSIINFLGVSLGANVSNIPIGATSSGTTFRFEGGVPVRTTTSPGPIFAERAQTLGRGRIFVSANVSRFNFKRLRGVDLDDVRLTFFHENSDFTGCDAAVGDDCSIYGVPFFENDQINLDLDLGLDVTAFQFVLTYGLLDRVDIGVVVPIVTTTLHGTSQAEIVPFGFSAGVTGQVAHFFGGTASDPVLLSDRSVVDGSATGIGDVAVRMKIGLGETRNARFAILGDARFATGDETNFLGSGDFSIRGLGVFSAAFGPFAPHANIGYVYRDSDVQNDAFLASVGFDHLLAPWAAMVVDVVSEFQVGATKLRLPDPIELESPFLRTISVTNLPDIRDDLINGSIGFKFVTGAGITLVTNALIPLNEGGLRPDVVWTGGIEYTF